MVADLGSWGAAAIDLASPAELAAAIDRDWADQGRSGAEIGPAFRGASVAAIVRGLGGQGP